MNQVLASITHTSQSTASRSTAFQLTAATWNCQHTPLRLPRSSPSSLDLLVSKSISNLAQSHPPSASPNTVTYSLQVTLQRVMVDVRRYRGNRGGQRAREYIFGILHCRKTSSSFHLILSYNENTHRIFPNLLSYSLCLGFRESTQLCWSSTLGSIIS
jgi:hypothetical protein